MDEEIRMLTLWQSWASLVSAGIKGFETRSWSTRYRGLLAVHAAKRPPCLVPVPRSLLSNSQIQAIQAMYPLPRGGVVAVCRLIDCQEMWDSKVCGPLMPPGRRGIDIASVSCLERSVGHWKEGRFAWKLDEVCSIETVWCKGGQGLRRVGPQVREEIGRQLRGCACG